jgi:hypothetical protein
LSGAAQLILDAEGRSDGEQDGLLMCHKLKAFCGGLVQNYFEGQCCSRRYKAKNPAEITLRGFSYN